MLIYKTKNGRPHYSQKVLIWIIPILLFVSSLGWRPVALEEPGFKINPTILILSQTVGITCSLLLGVWWIVVYRKNNYWGRASMGMFGICLTTFILFSIVGYHIQLLYLCGFLQSLWLAFLFWFHARDKAILERKSIEAEFNKALIPVFGNNYVRISSCINQLTGFLFFLFLTSFGWALISVPCLSYEIFRVLIMSMGLSLCGFLALGATLISFNKTKVHLISKVPGSDKEIRKFAFSECFGVSLFYIFTFILSSPIIGHPGLTAVVTLLVWFLFCLFYCTYLCRLVKKAKSSNAYQNLRKIYSENLDVAKREFGLPFSTTAP
jgi:hypothetical protein